MFTARLATAIVLLAACVSALLFLPNRLWVVVLLPVVFLAAWEWGALAGLRGLARWAYAGGVPGAAIVAVGVVATEPAAGLWLYGAAGVFWVIAVPLWLARGWRVRSAAVMAVVGLIVLVPASVALALLQVQPERLLVVLVIIWLSDTAAYLTGRTWGRRKLAPSISPGKTWEGLAGACAAVAVYYVGLSLAAPPWSGWLGAGGAILFGAVAVMGVVGDLFESWIKRQAAVKDSGALLPGHGGILDRIDSMTAALPIAALLAPFV